MHQLRLPKISERIRGFTSPNNGVFHAFDYDEVFRIELGENPKVEVLDENPNDFERECGEYYGVAEKKPILSAGGHEIAYDFNPYAKEIAVSVTGPDGKKEINFPILSGDWFVATIEGNGQYLFIAEPYFLRVYSLLAGENT